MHNGFKGSRIGVNSVSMSGQTISYEIAFIDDDGITHGTLRHTIPADGDPEIAQKADAFITALIHRAARVHFSQPNVSGAAKETNDLAHALGTSSSETDEPDGTPY